MLEIIIAVSLVFIAISNAVDSAIRIDDYADIKRRREQQKQREEENAAAYRDHLLKEEEYSRQQVDIAAQNQMRLEEWTKRVGDIMSKGEPRANDQ